MKNFVQCILYLVLISSTISCHHPAPESDLLLDGKPRIKSISFAGIPQENISIDQHTLLITVKAPTKIPTTPAVTVEVTDNAVWANTLLAVGSPVAFGVTGTYQYIIQDKNDKSSQTTYNVICQPSGPLQLDTITQPLTYTIINGSATLDVGITIPLLNLYGNPLPKEAHIINDQTGSTMTLTRGASFTDGLYYSTTNQISLYLFKKKILPGSYHIELLLDDNSVLKVSQPLLVSEGSIYIDYEPYTYFGYRAVQGKNFIISGFNLFSDIISLTLIDKQNQSTTLSDLAFEPYGQQLTVSLPASLQPGQYVIRVLEKPTQYSFCLRLDILPDELTRPILGTLVTSDPSEATPCSISDPVVAPKAIALFFTSNQTKQQLDQAGQHLVLKLAPAQGTDAYYATVAPFDGANTGYPGSFTIPQTVPNGLYTAILQVLDAQNNVVNESAPYGRTLTIK